MSAEGGAPVQLPSLPGLRLRHFRGPEDFPGMVPVALASGTADGQERMDTVDGMAEAYATKLVNCDPFQDMVIAEVDGRIVGYVRGHWEDDVPGTRVYLSTGFLAPEWRRRGIGRAMLAWVETRLRAVASTHPSGLDRYFMATADHFAVGTAALLREAGYLPWREFLNLTRSLAEPIPEAPLPPDLALRPVRPEDLPAIWASVHESPEDEWPYDPPTEDGYQAWLADETRFQPGLWPIAWDLASGEVAGHALPFIDEAENKAFDRLRGYAEGIGVSRAWRRRGLGRALVLASLRVLREAGMTEAALAADGSSAHDVARFYESCGFQVETRDVIYRKAL